MNKVLIGIYVHAEPERLLQTLASLRANTACEYELVLLPDGPDSATANALAGLSGIAQLSTSEGLGVAACFNRLAKYNDAEILVLLESGAQVTSGWLDHLLAALATDPANGLAGPSTNLSWNEQGAFPSAGGSDDELAAVAIDVRHRFGNAARTLEPLYSLADFCYLVRREVVEAIGAADEAYGLGPCWEMDYNIRAARAGWRGVWACASYVHRAPPTTRRRLEEARRFEISKRLYQDRFCGARLRGEKSDYRAHCRGDACANFAPPALIKINPTRSEIPTTGVNKSSIPNESLTTVHSDDAPQLSTRPLEVGPHGPLVTCIMPTCGRRSYLAHSVRCFLRQDYANAELLIVDDGVESVADCVPDDPRIRYVRLDQKLSIGAKRNFACEQARGEIIIHWDDDDWYPGRRVRVQTHALLGDGADVCGTSRLLYYDAAADEAWEYRYEAPGPAWVGGNTLAYRKSFWQRNPFPDVQVAEDSQFIWSSAEKKICDLAESSLCVAMIHKGNTSPKETSGSFWHSLPSDKIHAILGDERYLYCLPNAESLPLVSCIMPTYNRRPFVPQALELFAAQDYPNRELIVIDDGEDDVSDLAGNVPGVRYLRLPRRTTIGGKRNIGCQHAGGEIIAQWDDDDWYSPDRLRYQVMPILLGQADLTGLENAFVLHLPNGEFWSTQPPLHRRLFVGDVHGGTLVYRRELLTEGLRYPEINLAEDASLLYAAVSRGRRLLRLSNPGVFVYVRHSQNAWKEFAPGQFIDPNGWERVGPPLTFSSRVFDSYKAAGESLRLGNQPLPGNQ